MATSLFMLGNLIFSRKDADDLTETSELSPTARHFLGPVLMVALIVQIGALWWLYQDYQEHRAVEARNAALADLARATGTRFGVTIHRTETFPATGTVKASIRLAGYSPVSASDRTPPALWAADPVAAEGMDLAIAVPVNEDCLAETYVTESEQRIEIAATVLSSDPCPSQLVLADAKISVTILLVDLQSPVGTRPVIALNDGRPVPRILD